MTDLDGQEMGLTADAERVASDLAAHGAVMTSGHRHLDRQAHAMAVNTLQNRQWIGQTYLHGAEIQELVTHHPEWDTEDELSNQIFYFLSDHPDIAKTISHHLLVPCPCFDVKPQSVNDVVRQRIAEWEREGVITKVLWKEGWLEKCHIETALLPENKVEVI